MPDAPASSRLRAACAQCPPDVGSAIVDAIEGLTQAVQDIMMHLVQIERRLGARIDDLAIESRQAWATVDEYRAREQRAERQ
jgi:hypothetical protein